ncbi:unnamed protein product [Symbiodinium natans]|uniref:Uncharacterized protein n=1 Tax=Symbiodinium natans TaxID=878477 RepID=A0A812TXN1_9DINO|nr:unnamed protein product [Symbiodinium natans]
MVRVHGHRMVSWQRGADGPSAEHDPQRDRRNRGAAPDLFTAGRASRQKDTPCEHQCGGGGVDVDARGLHPPLRRQPRGARCATKVQPGDPSRNPASPETGSRR